MVYVWRWSIIDQHLLFPLCRWTKVTSKWKLSKFFSQFKKKNAIFNCAFEIEINDYFFFSNDLFGGWWQGWGKRSGDQLDNYIRQTNRFFWRPETRRLMSSIASPPRWPRFVVKAPTTFSCSKRLISQLSARFDWEVVLKIESRYHKCGCVRFCVCSLDRSCHIKSLGDEVDEGTDLENYVCSPRWSGI